MAKADGTRRRGASSGGGARRRAAEGAEAGRRTAARTVREAAPRHAMARVSEAEEVGDGEMAAAAAAAQVGIGFQRKGVVGWAWYEAQWT